MRRKSIVLSNRTKIDKVFMQKRLFLPFFKLKCFKLQNILGGFGLGHLAQSLQLPDDDKYVR